LKRDGVIRADARRLGTPGGELLADAIQPGKLRGAIARLDKAERVIGLRDPVGDRWLVGDNLAWRGVMVTKLRTQELTNRRGRAIERNWPADANLGDDARQATVPVLHEFVIGHYGAPTVARVAFRFQHVMQP